MKSFAISLIFLLMFGATTLAQTATKNYHFVYIDHEVNTPTTLTLIALNIVNSAMSTDKVRYSKYSSISHSKNSNFAFIVF